jgi:biopolymer transport protein ExbD
MSNPAPLDVTPILNVFIVIIPMMITMMVMIQISYISLSLSAGGGGGAGAGEKLKVVKVVLYNDKIEIQEEGSKGAIIPTYVDNGRTKYDFIALDTAITAVKQRNPNLLNIKVVPYPDVAYETLIRSIDICKLDGFPKVTYSIPETRFYQAAN